MKVFFLDEEGYQDLIASEQKDNIFRAIKFSHSLDKSGDLLGNASVVPLDDKEYEVWIANEPVKTHAVNGRLIYESGDLMYARFEGEEHGSLEHVAYGLYKEIFDLTEHFDGHLVRIWNYIPRILDHNESLERYREFNVGRRRAWEQLAPKDEDGKPAFPPAASGIGALGGPLKIGVIFSKTKPIHIQNPRQTNSFDYSTKFGPKPPTFSRATFLPGTGLFISGTASITQEESIHMGDPVAQTIETMRNIEALLFQENLENYGIKEKLVVDDIVDWRIYVKHAYHRDLIVKTFESNRQDNRHDFVTLHDDICRKELLLEIEGMILL